MHDYHLLFSQLQEEIAKEYRRYRDECDARYFTLLT